MLFRGVYSNAGLCGDIVSVGDEGTSYEIYGTSLGVACPPLSPPPPSPPSPPPLPPFPPGE